MTDNLITAAGKKSTGMRIGTVTTEINVDIGRPLSEEEARTISIYNELIHTMLCNNNYKNHPDTILQVADEKEKILACFPHLVYVKEIANGYTKDDTTPWYDVVTRIGTVIIGWRHRVISIDWSNSDQERSAEQLFPEEDVTKSGRLIHAYGYDKAREYLLKILNR